MNEIFTAVAHQLMTFFWISAPCSSSMSAAPEC